MNWDYLIHELLWLIVWSSNNLVDLLSKMSYKGYKQNRVVVRKNTTSKKIMNVIFWFTLKFVGGSKNLLQIIFSTRCLIRKLKDTAWIMEMSKTFLEILKSVGVYLVRWWSLFLKSLR